MKNQKMRSKAIICLFLLTIILLLSIYLVHINKENNIIPSEQAEKNSSANIYNQEGKDFNYWKNINNDVQFMININDKSFPVLYNKNKDFYLRKDIYGKDDAYGSVFLDENTTSTTKNLIIYGHSTFKKDLIFTFVKNYFEDESYYENHSTFTISDDEKEKNYRIIAIKKIDSNLSPWLEWYIPNTDESFDIVEYGTSILKNADKTYVDKLKVNKPFITLVTCDMDSYNNQTNETRFRYLLFAQEF